MQNTLLLSLCLSRRIAMVYKENQQAAIIQTAVRMMQQTDCEITKEFCLNIIAMSPAEKQKILNLAESKILKGE
jgi:hypothetical protein